MARQDRKVLAGLPFSASQIIALLLRISIRVLRKWLLTCAYSIHGLRHPALRARQGEDRAPVRKLRGRRRLRQRGELRLPRARGRRRLRQAQRALPRVPQREMARRRDGGRQLGARRRVRRARLPGGPDASLLRGIAAGVGPGLRERGADIRARRLLGLLPQGEVLEVGGPGSPKRIQANPALNAFKSRAGEMLRTDIGSVLWKRRSGDVETVFGDIERNLGFTRFTLRGLEKVTPEWRLVAAGRNIRKLFLAECC